MESAIPELNQAEQDRRIAETVARERPRLRSFIRRRVADEGDADDILQEVFYELVEAYRGTHPIDLASAWLFRVARNRIIDLFRKKKPESLNEEIRSSARNGEGDGLTLEDLLPSPDAGPDAAYARRLLLEHLEEALDELPHEQRAAFLGNEVEGKSFKAMSEESGVSINTLIARKRYAVLRLREKLEDVYEELSEG
jgi:RNA polymerase sigma factor (sigma-70 family)